MEPAVKRRAYSSPRRAQAARQTKAAILAASRPLFISQGYAGTTVAAIAEDATAQALEAGLSKDMRRKLERANGRVKALSGRTGRTALPVSVSDLPAAP